MEMVGSGLLRDWGVCIWKNGMGGARFWDSEDLGALVLLTMPVSPCSL